MAVRCMYTLRDERLMWEHVFERLQAGDEAAYQPKGLKLWKDFEATGKTNKTASSLATHFRKAMYDRIDEANLPVEQQLYIANQLTLPLSRRQQKSIEYKANISITTDSFGVVTSYEKEGKKYLPSILKRRISSEDDNINDELGYDAFELDGSAREIMKFSPSFDKNSLPETRCSSAMRYNLRKRSKVESSGSPKINDSEKLKVQNSVEDKSNRLGHRNEHINDGNYKNEIFKGDGELSNTVKNFSDRRMLYDREKNGSKKITREDAEGVIHENRLLPVDEEIDESKKVSYLGNGFSSSSEKSKTNMSCSRDEVSVVNFRPGKKGLADVMPANQIECMETDEFGINESAGTANAVKSVTSDNQQSVMKKISSKISNAVTFDRASSATTIFMKKEKALPFLDNTVDEELKQLLAYIQNKRQLKGVEKMKMEKILELRAKEARELGIGLRNYLRKIQQMIVSEADFCSITMF